MNAKRSSKRAGVVGVSMSATELAELDRQRAQLAGAHSGGRTPTRAAVVKMIWTAFAPEATERRAQPASRDVAVAESVAPLKEALSSLDAAVNGRARQIQSIGVHSNQVARFFNYLRISLRDGDQLSARDVRDGLLATEGIARALEGLAAQQGEDDALRAHLRVLIQLFEAGELDG